MRVFGAGDLAGRRWSPAESECQFISAREASLQINTAFDERLADRVYVPPCLDSPQRAVLDMDSTEIPVYAPHVISEHQNEIRRWPTLRG